MGEFKHLVLAKFKEGVELEELVKGMEELVSEIDSVNSFEWGQDLEGLEMLRQGFTHAFLMTFKTKEDFNAFNSHPKHLKFSATFAAAIDKFVVLDFPSALVKPPMPMPIPKSSNLGDQETSNKLANEESTDKKLEDQETSNNLESEETTVSTNVVC